MLPLFKKPLYFVVSYGVNAESVILLQFRSIYICFTRLRIIRWEFNRNVIHRHLTNGSFITASLVRKQFIKKEIHQLPVNVRSIGTKTCLIHLCCLHILKRET